MVDYSTAAWIKIILALVIAFAISFIATPLVKNFAVKVGAIDIPDKSAISTATRYPAWAAWRYLQDF